MSSVVQGIHVPDPMNLEAWEEQDEPLATDYHNEDQVTCFTVLKAAFAGPDCYVAMNRWLRMDPNHPEDQLLPDVLVAVNVPDAYRKTYDPVVEGKAPDLLVELLSESSLKADRQEKPPQYAALGVREYVVVNPGMQFKSPPLQGWRLSRSGPIEPIPLNPDGSLSIQTLAVRFAMLYQRLAILDRETGEPLTLSQATALRLVMEHEALERTQDRAERAEAEVATLRAEIERLRRGDQR